MLLILISLFFYNSSPISLRAAYHPTSHPTISAKKTFSFSVCCMENLARLILQLSGTKTLCNMSIYQHIALNFIMLKVFDVFLKQYLKNKG